jgi:hypothetical protein
VAAPINTNRTPSRITSSRTDRGVAPTDSRMPISRVRARDLVGQQRVGTHRGKRGSEQRRRGGGLGTSR